MWIRHAGAREARLKILLDQCCPSQHIVFSTISTFVKLRQYQNPFESGLSQLWGHAVEHLTVKLDLAYILIL